MKITRPLFKLPYTSEQLGGRQRASTAFRDSRGRFLPAYGFFSLFDVLERLEWASKRELRLVGGCSEAGGGNFRERAGNGAFSL